MFSPSSPLLTIHWLLSLLQLRLLMALFPLMSAFFSPCLVQSLASNLSLRVYCLVFICHWMSNRITSFNFPPSSVNLLLLTTQASKPWCSTRLYLLHTLMPYKNAGRTPGKGSCPSNQMLVLSLNSLQEFLCKYKIIHNEYAFPG